MKFFIRIVLIIVLLFPASVFASGELPPGPVVTPDGEPAPAQADDEPSYQQQVLELVNQARWDNGQLPPLKDSSLLESAAMTHSSNMANRDFFAHCDLDTKTSPGDRIEAAGYDWSAYGENIAAGYGTPEEVMAGWMGSSGHRSNILSTGFRELGVGYVYQSDDATNVRKDDNRDCNSDGTYGYGFRAYWTQNFGRTGTYPVVINREAYETASREVELYIYRPSWTAVEMRFRNEVGDWSAWLPYQETLPWTLSPGTGEKTVTVELRSGSSGTPLSSSDTILSTDNEPVVPVAVLAASPVELGFGFTPTSPPTQTQTLSISNSGDAPLDWSLVVTPAAGWLAVEPTGGSLAPGDEVLVSLTASSQDMDPGVYQTGLQVEAGGALGSPQAVAVTLLVTESPQVFLPALSR